MPWILTGDDDRVPAADWWLLAQETDQCEDGPCNDDPDCPCRKRAE